MKKRIEALEATRKSVETDKDQIIEFAQQWRTAVVNHNWKKAVSIREAAQPLFEEYPDWAGNPKDLRLNKTLYIDWRFFVNYLDEDIQKRYNQAIKEGISPGFALIDR